jgi:hypothetical protein
MTQAGSCAPSTLRRILFDPLSWLADPCLPIVVPALALDLLRAPTAAVSIAWINQVIVDTHGLVCTIAPAELASIPPWLDHWSRLRRAAYLIGCRCLRDDLVIGRRFASLDPCARRFALLPVIVPTPRDIARRVDPPDDTCLIAEGYRCMFSDTVTSSTSTPSTAASASAAFDTRTGSHHARALPHALQQRLRLLFADVDATRIDATAARDAGMRVRASPTLFESAIHHAATH